MVSGVLSATDSIGIGTTSPTAQLEVNGQVKITGGSPGADKVLTSDASGLGSWQTPAGGGLTLPYSGSTSTSAGSNAFSVTYTGIGPARAVFGRADNSGNYTNYGGYFQADGTSGQGVYGYATGSYGRGVYGYASNTGSSTNYGGYFSYRGS